MLTILAAGVPLLENPEFYVGLSFLGFVAVILYYKVPSMMGRSLDTRAERIRKELDEARRLREEAQQLLADYQRKAAKAEDEAREIIERAQAEAKALGEETRRTLAESLERRTRMAEEKIQRAEAQAISDVRAAAVDRAVEAAERIIRSRVSGGAGDRFVADSIDGLRGKLN